jgi:1-acyl-sn-glycerol-3-phosphate acyltransferase
MNRPQPPDRFGIFSASAAFANLYAQAAQQHSKLLNGDSLDGRDPGVISEVLPLLDWLYHYYFRVQTEGWEHLPDRQVMLIASHNGGMASPDLFMFFRDWCQRFGLERQVYALMNPKVWKVFTDLAKLATQTGALQAHPKMAIAALQSGADLLIYPGGAKEVFRPYSQRKEVHLYNRKGFIKVALRQEVPIVPLVSYGAHSTLFVLTDLYPYLKQLHRLGIPWLFGIDPEVYPLYLGLPWGLGVGPIPNIPLPMPIRTKVCPAIVFEKYGLAASQEQSYVDECYRLVHTQMQLALDQLVQEYEAAA